MGKVRLNHKYFYIYKITNLITNKIYIGKRCSDKDPEIDSYFGSGRYLHNSIKKYGKENFKKDIIELCKNGEHLSEREIFWIASYDSTNVRIGYNLSKGGDGGVPMFGNLNPMYGKTCEDNPFFGRKHKQETIDIIVEKLKNREIVECPWCGEIMNIVNARQYHFDNCMMNPNVTKEEVFKRKTRMIPAKLVSHSKLKCPHCGVLASHTNSKKYHFENCIHAPVLSEYTINRLKERDEGRYAKKEKLRLERESREIKIYKCEYCEYETESLINFNKWHGDNCTNNPNCNRQIYTCYKCGATSTNKTNITRFHNDNCEKVIRWKSKISNQ